MAWRDLGPLDEFPDGGLRRIEAGGRALVVVRFGERLWALRDICPHHGARLSGGGVGGRVPACRPGEEIRILDDEPVLTCPWHGLEFDVATGRSLVKPEDTRVRTYEARVEGGRVIVTSEGQ